MEFPTPLSELVVFLTHILRIPREDSREYAKELARIGYDDIQSFVEDLTLEEATKFMKPGHLKRVEIYLANIKDKDKRDLLRVIKKEISDEGLFQQVWILKPNCEVDAIDIIAPIIKMPPHHGRHDHDQPDFLDIIGFKRSKVYSKFEKGYVENKGKDIELLDILDKGPNSCVYLAVHVYTLALLAVKSISLDAQSQGSNRLQLVTSELNVLSLVSRVPMQNTYCGQDPYCGICPGGKCQVPAANGFKSPAAQRFNHVTFESDKTELSTEPETPHAQCPFIVSFYDAFTNITEGEMCLLFEYMGQGDLLQLCERKWLPSNRDMAVICYSVLSALAELHSRRIIHRDIKMQNILVSQNGCVKVTDFGIVSTLPMETGASAKTFTGTLSYMSPERLKGQSYSYECDIWAFGITMLTLCNYKYCQGKSIDEQFFGKELSYWDIVESIINGKHLKEFIQMSTNGLEARFKDFVLQCLEADATRRPTASELLQHPFIQAHLHDIPEVAAAGAGAANHDHTSLSPMIQSAISVSEPEETEEEEEAQKPALQSAKATVHVHRIDEESKEEDPSLSSALAIAVNNEAEKAHMRATAAATAPTTTAEDEDIADDITVKMNEGMRSQLEARLGLDSGCTSGIGSPLSKPSATHFTATTAAAVFQPRLSHLPNIRPSDEHVAEYTKRIADHMFCRHRDEGSLDATEIWEEPNRRHLALAFGIDYDLLTEMLQSELDRRSKIMNQLREFKDEFAHTMSSSSSHLSSSSHSSAQSQSQSDTPGAPAKAVSYEYSI